jgi:quinol monooxygenase YgiN
MMTASTRWSIDPWLSWEDTLMHHLQIASKSAGCLAIAAAIFAGAPARAQSGGEAVYAVTYVDISNDWVPQGAGLLKDYRDKSRRETDNLEFTVVQELGRPNRFAIMEGWKDQAAVDSHAKGANASQFNFILEAIRNAPPDRHMLNAFATAPARAPAPAGALYMVEHIDFMGNDPAVAIAAEPLVKSLAAASQKEPGVMRYDVYQQPKPRINHYEVVGVWNDAAAFDAHENAAPTRSFRAATTMPAMVGRANLYDQRLYKALE